MNQQQAVQIITYLNRAGLVGAMEGQAAVWADALADIEFEAAQAAARALTRTRLSTERWVTPGDVRAKVSGQGDGYPQVGTSAWDALTIERQVQLTDWRRLREIAR